MNYKGKEYNLQVPEEHEAYFQTKEKESLLDTIVNEEVKIKKSGGQFVMTSFEHLDGEKFLTQFRSEYMLYLKLRRCVVRAPFEGDLGLYKNYYCKGILAASKSTRWLAEQFGYKDGKQIKKWIHALEEKDILKLDSVDVGQPRKQFVFILGYVKNDEEMHLVDVNL